MSNVRASLASEVPYHKGLGFTFLLIASLALGATTGANADGLVLWNKLGSASEILNSAYGPDLEFYSGGDVFSVSATPSYVPGVFGNALTIGSGAYRSTDRVRNVVVNDLDQILDPSQGTIEVWVHQVADPVGYSHNPHRIFDGSFGLGSGMALQTYEDKGLRFHLNFGGTTALLTNDISSLNGTWVHVAGVWDVDGIKGSNDKIRLYVNGQMVASGTSAEWGSTVGSRADIASGNDGNIAGKFYVDNLKLFDYARTDFSNRMQEDDGLAPPESGLIAYYCSASRRGVGTGM
ncbi:MAG: LamG domain-containing protein [Verrucomicrobia bacterium]|nr:LamG domain-containing protein [Verrucomicrobiota bacterium]